MAKTDTAEPEGVTLVDSGTNDRELDTIVTQFTYIKEVASAVAGTGMMTYAESLIWAKGYFAGRMAAGQKLVEIVDGIVRQEK